MREKEAKAKTTMLALEVEYLTGVVRASRDQGDAADWPPQPDRLFSALVATWAARGERPEERAALEWLERAPAPVVEASPAHPRGLAKVFVPPNDDGATAISVIPDRRRRQERRLATVIPESPVVRWRWPVAPDAPVRDALAALAHDTSYLGHSASLIRCTLREQGALDEPCSSRGVSVLRMPYPGRLAELERAFAAGRRPSPGASLRHEEEPAVPPACSIFGRDWIIFADAGGMRPDTVAAAVLGKFLIKAVQAGYAPAAAPPWVSGHLPDGAPLSSPHLAALPLIDAGWEWSQGRLMGMALAIPRHLEDAARRARDTDAPSTDPEAIAASEQEGGLFRALARINVADSQGLEIALRLPGGQEWRLQREASPAAQSLRPSRYTHAARLWASVTPIALDRHPKTPGDVEDGIATACERIGLPRPQRVVSGKHSAVTGVPSAQPGARSPEWTGWRLPGALSGRRLTHAVIAFDVPVSGPVVLGAGRFSGLGLCLPLPEPRQA